MTEVEKYIISTAISIKDIFKRVKGLVSSGIVVHAEAKRNKDGNMIMIVKKVVTAGE